MKLFLIAGEPSGDALGAALMRGLRQLAPTLSFVGVGGPLMEAEGLKSRFPMEELSVMGLAEVLPRLRGLLRRVRETANAVVAEAPDALVTIDSPDFGLRVARRVRAEAPGVRTVHYVAPTVWAWRPGRARKMARCIDHVLALFPFEPHYMQAAGMSCDFTGHPIATMPVASQVEVAAFRSAQGFGAADPVILCLPGSRRGEVARLAPRFGKTLALLRQRHRDLRVVIPTVPAVASQVRGLVATWEGGDALVVEDAPGRAAAFAAADVALAASGTVSLELAANDVPMVIAYDMNPISRLVIGKMLVVDTVTLVNLVSETRVIPEFLGRDCQPQAIAAALDALLADPSARSNQLAAMAVTMTRLGRGGEAPGLRAARSVLRLIGAAPDPATAKDPA